MYFESNPLICFGIGSILLIAGLVLIAVGILSNEKNEKKDN